MKTKEFYVYLSLAIILNLGGFFLSSNGLKWVNFSCIIFLLGLLFFRVTVKNNNQFIKKIIIRCIDKSSIKNAISYEFALNNHYWKSVNIYKNSKGYSIIVWGDKKSRLWKYKKDNIIQIDNSSKNKKDKKILSILNS